MNPSDRDIPPLALLYAIFAMLVAGCEPSQRGSGSANPAPTASPAAIKNEVDFPESLRVADPSVNDAIDRAIAACFSGDYERFRLLWSIRQNPPFTEQEFNIALKGGAKVTINRLQKFRTPEREVIYAVAGRVELFQPDIPDPVRDVVLLLVKESGQWRLAVAPGYVRKALENMDRAAQSDESAEIPVTPEPSSAPVATPSSSPAPSATSTPPPTSQPSENSPSTDSPQP